MPVRKSKETQYQPPSDRLLTPAEARQKLGLGKTKFHELVKVHPLRVIDFGKRTKRYNPTDLEDWVEQWEKNARDIQKESEEEKS